MLFVDGGKTFDLDEGSKFYLVSEIEMDFLFRKIFPKAAIYENGEPRWLSHMKQFAGMPFTIARISQDCTITGGLYLRSVEGYEKLPNSITDECYIITPHFLTTENASNYDDVNSESSDSVSSLFQ